MKISRRKFLEGAPLAVLSAGIVLELSGKVSAKGFGNAFGSDDSEDVLSTLGWDSFYAYLNTDFVFRDENGNSANLQLAKMIDAKPKKSVSANGECFSLIFRDSGSERLPGDNFRVEHFALGNFGLMITFMGRNRSGLMYEAIINRLQP